MYSLTIPRIAVPADGHRDPVRQLKTVRRPPIYPNGAQAISPVAPSPLFRCPHAVHRCPSVSFGGFGLKWRALYKLGCCLSRLVSRVTSLRLARFPSATRNITLLPSAWGEKNPDTWSS